MKSGWLEIELKSPLCAATGDGIAGLVDTDIAHECGLPVIPAKRLKGCLLAVGKELGAYDTDVAAVLGDLFGRVGSDDSAALHIEAAHLYKIPNFSGEPKQNSPLEVVDYPAFVSELKQHMQASDVVADTLCTEEVLTYFSRLRTRTAINSDTGNAKKTGLYTMRVAHKGLVFRARITLCESAVQEKLAQVLTQCVKGLRHIGLGITRGFGEVRCRLVFSECAVPAKAAFDILAQANKTGTLYYYLDVKSPLLISGQGGLYSTCEDYIPGSAILGALAGMYIADYLPDQAQKENAHENEDFRAIFLRERVHFGYAFPAIDDQQIFYPCPGVLQREKTQGLYYNVAKSTSDMQLRAERRFIAFSPQDKQAGESADLRICEVAKEIRMHHARPLDRGIGYAVRDDKAAQQNAAQDGQFFQYVSISAGQRFCGTWHGSQMDIQKLLDCLCKRANRLRLGRSRSAEYGDVSFTPVRFEPDGAEVPAKVRHEQMVLWLLTPLSLRDAAGRDSVDPTFLIKQINEELSYTMEIEQKFISVAKLAGYNAKWRLPKQQKNVLAAGTALVVKTNGSISPNMIERKYWGEDTGEGCGRIKVIYGDMLEEKVEGLKGYGTKPCPVGKTQVNESTHPLLRVLLAEKAKRNAAYDDTQKAFASSIKEQESAMIERLLACFAEAGGSYQALLQQVEKIKNEKKREKIEMFLKPCNGQSDKFVEIYLQRAKWEARGERSEDAGNHENKG